MSNASALFRSLLAYGICLPLAVLLGYLLATPLDFTTVGVVGVVVFVLAMPVLLRWHHFFLIAAWNTTALVFFVPGKPPLWMALAALSLGICILQCALNRNMKFLSVPSVARSLLFLTGVVLLTMSLTGGLGLASFGSDTNGGKKYISLLAAIAGFFAMINRQIPSKRAGLYVALFLLGGASMLIADLPGRVSPSFSSLFVLFPVTSVAAFAEKDSVFQTTSLISRLSGLAYVGSAVICLLLARYGLRGVLDVTKPWRLSLLCLFFAIALFSGFRSTFITLVLTFGLLFYLEGMHRTRWLLPVVFLLLAGGSLVVLFAPRLPYSIQRSLAVLPFVPVDPVARIDAATSNDWRLQVWRESLPDIPQHLFVGKGYAFSATEQEQAEMRAAKMGGNLESVEMVGNYHNGPLSVILAFGIFGSLAVLCLFAAGIRVLYQNYQFGDPALRNINTFLFCYFVVSVVVFFVVYGALDTDLRVFLGVLGLGISLNGGVAAAAPAESTVTGVELRTEYIKA
jgi:hypothetical protein